MNNGLVFCSKKDFFGGWGGGIFIPLQWKRHVFHLVEPKYRNGIKKSLFIHFNMTKAIDDILLESAQNGE